jgi:alpha-tubulin suppressor-like RCC1 family protein
LGVSNIPETENFQNLNYKTKKISTGEYHSLILTINNQLFSFGGNDNGQLGLGLAPTENIFIPTLVKIEKKNY